MDSKRLKRALAKYLNKTEFSLYCQRTGKADFLVCGCGGPLTGALVSPVPFNQYLGISINGLKMKISLKWILTAITFILVSYAGVLGYVAINTERDVQFWPPRIGPADDPSAPDASEDSDCKPQRSRLRITTDRRVVSTGHRPDRPSRGIWFAQGQHVDG